MCLFIVRCTYTSSGFNSARLSYLTSSRILLDKRFITPGGIVAVKNMSQYGARVHKSALHITIMELPVIKHCVNSRNRVTLSFSSRILTPFGIRIFVISNCSVSWQVNRFTQKYGNFFHFDTTSANKNSLKERKKKIIKNYQKLSKMNKN